MTPAPAGASGPEDRRLRRSRDFRAVMRGGKRARSPLLYIAARCNDRAQSRFGYAVGRRVGKAVTRNRVRRRLRAIMRDLPVRGGHDIVTVAQEPSNNASYWELKEAVEQCLRKIGLLDARDR